MNQSFDEDDSDELLYEVDVEFHRPQQPIYLFQHPIRPYYRPYDETSFTNARIKEKLSLVEMDLFIDCQSSNYYSVRGKQFAEPFQNDDRRKYFNTDRMDKQTISSTTSKPGKLLSIDRKTNLKIILGDCYMVGFLHQTGKRLVICPLKSIVQFRPQFSYLDPPSSTNTSVKENAMHDDDGLNMAAGTSDADLSGSETEEIKAEPTATLITMKFARKESEHHKKRRLQSYGHYRQMRDEERWQDLICVMNAHSFEAERFRHEFLATNQELS